MNRLPRISGSVRSQTPPISGADLACLLATLAKVLVGPRPTQVGILASASTVSLIVRPRSTRSPTIPSMDRNISSIE